ncbi:MAG: hypothetical protein ACKV2Q_33020 [Planctomycetaceae bacterium]
MPIVDAAFCDDGLQRGIQISDRGGKGINGEGVLADFRECFAAKEEYVFE